MNKINSSFIRSVESKIDECSSISQLTEVFKRFQTYIYNKHIFNSFLNRIDFFESRSVDSFISDMCERLRDDIEMERTILGVSSDSKCDKLEINLVIFTDEGKILQDCIEELIRSLLQKTNGKKQETARILGISLKELNSMLNDDLDKTVKSIKKSLKK